MAVTQIQVVADHEVSTGRWLPIHKKWVENCQLGGTQLPSSSIYFTNHSGTFELKTQSPCPGTWWAHLPFSSIADKMVMLNSGFLQTQIISVMLLGKAPMYLMPILQKALWLSFPSCDKPLIIHSGVHKYCTVCLQLNSASRLFTISWLVKGDGKCTGV